MAAEIKVDIDWKVCPKCNKEYKGHPAISREDNITAICPLCGSKEALKAMGIPDDEIENIVSTIPKPEYR